MSKGNDDDKGADAEQKKMIAESQLKGNTLRTYIYASFLLTYSPSYSMLQEAFQSAHSFPVMPETGFVPMNPLTTSSSVSGYLTSTGAYMRQFGACYYRGAYKGKCAVVVNPSGSTVSIPTTAYSHSLGLVGGGVLDGGYVTFTNSRPIVAYRRRSDGA